MMKRKTNWNDSGVINIIGIAIILVAIVILVIMGALVLLYAPNIAAAVLISGLAIFILVKVPIPDIKLKIGLVAVLIFIAGMIYYYGNDILGAVV